MSQLTDLVSNQSQNQDTAIVLNVRANIISSSRIDVEEIVVRFKAEVDPGLSSKKQKNNQRQRLER
jgi:hypothetical protein